MTKTRPAPSISAEGSGGLRKLAGLAAAVIDVIVTKVQHPPPFEETSAPSVVSDALSIGMITFPVGWTSGWPPITPTFGVVPAIQVSPPLVEEEIFSRLECPASSNCT